MKSSASPSSMTYTLNGAAEMINLPNYPSTPPYQVSGTSTVPSNSPAGSVMTLQFSQNSFTDQGDSPPSVSGTPDFYTTLEFSEATTFGNGSTTLKIPVTLNSPCITSGTTYTVTEASGGLTAYTETDTATQAGTVTGHIEAALNPVPANEPVFIVVSH